MSNDNGQVAHLWANRSKESAKSNNGNFHFRGDTIYSYATPVARLYPNCALVTSRRYSNTTSSKHMLAIHRALNCKTFHVPSIGAYGGMNRDDGSKPKHADNLAHYQKQFADALTTWRLAKDSWNLANISGYASGLAYAMRDYANCFGLKAKAWRTPYDTFRATRESVQVFRAEREAKFNTPAAKAKRAKDAAKREAKRQRKLELAHAAETERAAAWLTGELDHYRTSRGIPALLRVKGDTLQTSQGACVPLDHATRAFRFMLIRLTHAAPSCRVSSLGNPAL